MWFLCGKEDEGGEDEGLLLLVLVLSWDAVGSDLS